MREPQPRPLGNRKRNGSRKRKARRLSLERLESRRLLAAEVLLRMALRGDNFDPVAVYAPDYRKRLCTGADAKKPLEATL